MLARRTTRGDFVVQRHLLALRLPVVCRFPPRAFAKRHSAVRTAATDGAEHLLTDFSRRVAWGGSWIENLSPVFDSRITLAARHQDVSVRQRTRKRVVRRSGHVRRRRPLVRAGVVPLGACEPEEARAEPARDQNVTT